MKFRRYLKAPEDSFLLLGPRGTGKSTRDFADLSKDKIKATHLRYCGQDRMRDDGVDIWPVAQFMTELFQGAVI